MNILIIHAHENPSSFSGALADTAKTYFSEKEHSVTISDLYKKEFNPMAGRHDFKALSNNDYYKYALEQYNANTTNSFTDDISHEMRLLERADILIFNFPLWWFGMPAILKGWVDRVLAYGFAYGGDYGLYKDGKFKGKKAFLSITTGSPASFYSTNGAHGRSLENILKNINEGILGLIGYQVLPSFIAYAVSRSSEEYRNQILRNYRQYLNEYLS